MMRIARVLPVVCLLVLLSVGLRLAVAAEKAPPPGFVALFNGKDLAGWKGQMATPPKRAAMSADELAKAQAQADEEMRKHWSIVDGVVTFDGDNQGGPLCTAKDYANFELLVDWKIDAGGDSGVYLRGCPQVQIWDPASNAAMGVGSGGLYNNQKNPSKPLVVADNPIDQWNTFRITMVGDKVTVYLNDKLVVDNVPLENYWERDKPVYSSGPIELQQHGSKLQFKNIYLKELK